MRAIEALVIHCSANRPNQDIGLAEIDRLHRGKGWSMVGYHFIIRRSGALEFGRPIEQAGAHVEGHNARTVGICLIGGLDAKDCACTSFEAAYTEAQATTLLRLLGMLKALFPAAEIKGHRDYPGVKKDCPCFDVRAWTQRHGFTPRA